VIGKTLPYCGSPPVPGDLLARFNLDPILLLALVVLLVGHVLTARGRRDRLLAAAGWSIATVAFVSPLCALSVALFSARVAQHMILVLFAAPLIALAWPERSDSGRRKRGARGLWAKAAAFFVALWFWHMPVPYDATFSSTPLYWLMHITLFGSAILLWRELLHHSAERTAAVLAVGGLTSMQMGLLGAVLTFAQHPLFFWHITTSWAWGLTPLRDQELGGVFMWVPGIALFLFAASRSLARMWKALEAERPA
jgi:putative membrane protein